MYLQNYISQKINDYKKIYEFFYKMSGNNHFKTIKRIIDSTLMIIKMFICQSMIDIQCTQIHKHVYDIQYQIHLKQYKIRVHHKKGPSVYEHFYDQDGNNITYDILPYLGPNQDFHGISYTPNDFGFLNMTIEYQDGNKKLFEKHEIIGEYQDWQEIDD